LGNISIAVKLKEVNMQNLIDVLINHQSIRKFSDKEVTEDTINQIISCAQMAPTSSHFQAYSIIDVRDRKKRESLAQISGGQPWVEKAPLVLMFCGDLHRGKKYYENVDPGVFENTEQYTIGTIDAALAAQKALIAAQALGLGGVFVGGIRNDVEAISKEFKLPKLVYPLFALCLGYPDDNPGQKPRLPMKVVHKVDFYDESNDEKLIDDYNRTMIKYYKERTNYKEDDSWTKRCGSYLKGKTRDEVGEHFRQIGLLKR